MALRDILPGTLGFGTAPLGNMLLMFAMAVLENLGYRQLNTLWRCRGMWQWFSRRKHNWGVMRRSGTWGQ